MLPVKVTRYAADDPAVWPLVGPLLTSRAVQADFGAPTFADGAVAWWVATHRGRVVGMCALKEVRGERWEDCSWVAADRRGRGVHLALCAARTRHLATLAPLPLNVCCREARWKHYADRGFAVKRRAGAWVYGVKLPPKEEAK